MTDPTRITVTARPNGADLDVAPYLRTTLKDLLGLLAEREDLLDDLLILLNDPAPAPAADRFAPDVASRDERFLDRLMAELPTTIRMHLTPARKLGAALGRVTRAQARRPLRSIPAQQDRRAS